MFKSRQKRTDPYGIAPLTPVERRMLTHGDPVTIALAKRVADSVAMRANASQRLVRRTS